MPLFRKSAPNDPKMTLTCSRSNVYIYLLHTSPRPKFSSISLYNEQFSSYSPIFRKVHQMTSNDRDIFKVKNTNMNDGYNPEAQIFICFALQRAVFELEPNFGSSSSILAELMIRSQMFYEICSN